jgi:hypothetical protein
MTLIVDRPIKIVWPVRLVRWLLAKHNPLATIAATAITFTIVAPTRMLLVWRYSYLVRRWIREAGTPEQAEWRRQYVQQRNNDSK